MADKIHDMWLTLPWWLKLTFQLTGLAERFIHNMAWKYGMRVSEGLEYTERTGAKGLLGFEREGEGRSRVMEARFEFGERRGLRSKGESKTSNPPD